MIRYNLKSQIRNMNIECHLKVPKGYEEQTIRNYATCIGKELNRSYSVMKQNKSFIVIRTS